MDQVKRQPTQTAAEAIITTGSVSVGLRKQVVVFLPVSAQPSSGNSRLHTTLSRHLSELGITSVRIRHASIDTWTTSELSDLLDWITIETAATEFIFYGAGKAAYETLPLAVEDSRVKGLFLVDSIGFRTRSFYRNHYLLFGPRRFFSRQTWTNWMQKFFAVNRQNPDTTNRYYPMQSPTADAQSQRYLLWSLFHRRKLLHFVFTGSAAPFYNHGTQFSDMCDGLNHEGTVSHSHLPFADHHFILSSQRAQLVNSLINWVNQHFPVETTETERKAA